MHHFRKFNMICFDLLELKTIFDKTQTKNILEILSEKGRTLEELQNSSKDEKEQIIDELVVKRTKAKEDIELFVSLDAAFTFYKKKDTKICFVLKDEISPQSVNIEYLDELKKIIKENELTDFAIWSDGLRQFQLKQYRRKMETEEFSKFLKDVTCHYGNTLGEVNLLILLQGDNNADYVQECNLDFKKIHTGLCGMHLNSAGEILVWHNEANRYTYIHQLYPELKVKKKKFDLSSMDWNLDSSD